MAITNYPPRPNNISIPAVVAGNILQSDDTSVSVIEDGLKGSVVLKTDNKLAMVINKDQKVSINTQSTDSMITINNDLSTTSTIRLSYQDSYYFDGSISPNGNVVFTPSCDDQFRNPIVATVFQKNFYISDHDGMTTGLHLGGMLITASAFEINYVDVPAGRAIASKALVLDGNRNISGINQLDASLLTGTLLTGPQPNITSLGDVDITGELKIRGAILDVSPMTLRYLKITFEGVAQPSKAMILDSNQNFGGVNTFTATTLIGTLAEGPQPNITSLSSLRSLTNNGISNLNGPVNIKLSSDQLKIYYDDQMHSTFGTNSQGDMILKSWSNKIRLDTSSFYIPSHNGINAGLYLGSELVSATASQLNYTDISTEGTAEAKKALVLDMNKNISGINILVATQLWGAVQTASQPLIRSVSTLDITSHNGTSGLSLNGVLVNASAAQLNYSVVVPGSAMSLKSLVLDNDRNISGINSLSANSVAGVLTTALQPNISSVHTLAILHHNGTAGLRLGNTLVTASANEINRISVQAGTASAEKALVLDSSKNITGINSLEANNLSGVVQTSIQPNINQVNVLNISNHNGTTTGLALKGVLITSTASQLNRLNVVAGTADRNKALVLDSNYSIININVLSAITLGGVLSSPNQPNIRRLTSIDIIDHNASTTGLSLNGTLITSDANQLNYVNVERGVATPNKAIVLDSSRSITNLNTVSATNISGVLTTASQPFINQVQTLNITNHDGNASGLSLNGVLIKSSADQLNYLTQAPGIAGSNKVVILDELKNISGINSITANTLAGTLSTAFQPTLSSVNTLNVLGHNGGLAGLSLGGILITSTADQLNRVNTQAGIAVASKALVFDNAKSVSGINSLSADVIGGTLTTSYQPNIQSVDIIDIKNHNGGSAGLSLNGKLVRVTASQLNYNDVVPGRASVNSTLVTDEFNSIKGINNLSATKITSQQLSLTGIISNFNTDNIIIKSYSFAQSVGRLVDIQLIPSLSINNFQPADMLNGYFCEIIGYINPQYSESYRFFAICNDRVRVWINGELILHSWVASTTARPSSSIFLNAQQWVPIYIQYQVDIGSSQMFVLEWTSNSTTRQVIPSSRMAWDNNPPAVSSNHFSQNSLSIYNTSTPTANTARLSVDTGGDLTIDASGNDVSLGASDNFSIQSHNGTSRGLYLGGVLVESTAFELNYLKVSPGIASASHALVIDASKSLTGINSLTATSIACTNLSTSAFTINNLNLTGPLNNYNFGSLLIRQMTGPDATGRIVNVNTIEDINLNGYDPSSLNSYFSLDIIGYVSSPTTEAYTFHAIANDRVRIWVGNTLILNIWDTTTGVEYASNPIPMISGQWTPIYIQYQNLIGSSSLQVKWSSSTVVKSFISRSNMAWDNSVTRPHTMLSSADRITLYSSASGLTTIQGGSIAIDGNGTMNLSSSSKVIRIASAHSLNIVDHNGTTGLQLAGALVTATASELNYLAGVSPGSTAPFKALILDSSKSLSGLDTIASTNISGTLTTAAQPNIKSFGTLASTLNTTSDIVIASTNYLRIASDASACLIQAGSSNTSNSSADLFIGNYGASPTTSSRKIMIKSSGFVGIQTTSPTRTLSVNGAGAAHCVRLIHNSSNGSESAFCDIGVDASSNLNITSNLIIGSSNTATLAVSSNGVMSISSSGGSVQIGNTTNSNLPLEIGSSLFNLTSNVGYINSSGSVGSGVSSSTSYSLRTTSSIIVNGTVCITSDRRLKHNITELNGASCRKFIMNSKTIQYNFKSDPSHTRHCGLMAQEVLKTEFSDLVKLAPYEGLKEEIDADGCVSPADAAFNVSYEEIIPILLTSMKETMTENVELKEQVGELQSQMSEMQARMKEIEEMISKFS